MPGLMLVGKTGRSSFHLTGRLRYQAGPCDDRFASWGPRPDQSRLLHTFGSRSVTPERSAFRWPDAESCWFGRIRGISSPGMLGRSENVGHDDASVGVARNPLRDGAPPTGSLQEPYLETSHVAGSGRVHEAARRTSSGLGSAMTRPGSRRVTAIARRVGPAKCGHRLRHSSKHCNPRIKDG